MIKAIIFDCFGVVYGTSFEHIRDQAPEDRRAELEDYRIRHDRGFMQQDEFLEAIGKIIDWPPQKVGEYMRARHVLNESVVACIRELKKEYRIGLLTNVGHGWIDELFPAELKKELFDSVVESDIVHMIKPEPEIYQYAARELDVLPEECCFIDDSPRNVEGSRQVGMKEILFTSAEDMIDQLRERGVNYARAARS